MANNNHHTGKSHLQREAYKKAVLGTSYSQTSDESLKFDNSDSPLEEITDFVEETIQKEPLKDKAKSFWESHKFEISMAIITAILSVTTAVFGIFAISLNRESGEHSVKIDSISNDISSLNDDIKEQTEIINQLSLSNVENKKDIQYLQQNLERMEATIEKLNSKLENKKN